MATTIPCFRRLLERDPSHVAALKGLSESLLARAAEQLEQHVDANVVDGCGEAVAALTAAAALRPEVTCLWRLLGDALTLMQPIPEDVVAPFEVPARLAGVEGQSQAGRFSVRSQIGARFNRKKIRSKINLKLYSYSKSFY